MESAPVVGVDTRKLSVELLLAPSFLSEAATGITPHEQIGKGTPNNDALKIDQKLFLPKWRVMNFVPKNTCSNPAMNIPNNRYGAMESQRSTIALIMSKMNSISVANLLIKYIVNNTNNVYL